LAGTVLFYSILILFYYMMGQEQHRQVIKILILRGKLPAFLENKTISYCNDTQNFALWISGHLPPPSIPS
jgi:hypothetical protein